MIGVPLSWRYPLNQTAPNNNKISPTQRSTCTTPIPMHARQNIKPHYNRHHAMSHAYGPPFPLSKQHQLISAYVSNLDICSTATERKTRQKFKRSKGKYNKHACAGGFNENCSRENTFRKSLISKQRLPWQFGSSPRLFSHNQSAEVIIFIRHVFNNDCRLTNLTRGGVVKVNNKKAHNDVRAGTSLGN